MTERLIQASGELGAATMALTRTQSGLDALAGQLGETTKTLESAVRDHQQRFEQIDQQLAGAFGVFVKGADQYRGHLQVFMRELDGHLDKTLGAIANGVDELAHVVEELGRTGRQLDLAKSE
jgi:phage-related tail protein